MGTTLTWVSTKAYEGTMENHQDYREAKVTLVGVVQTKALKIYGLHEDHGNDCMCSICCVNQIGTQERDKKIIFKDFISWVKSLPPGKLTITQEVDV